MGHMTHDFRNKANIGYKPLPGNRLKAHGWGGNLSEGDFLLLPNGDRDTRYRVETIRYELRPADQWFATLTFAPRAD